jgi:hypothetical protein
MRVPRVLSAILLTYLFLDVANPMMPGAVQFVDGSIQVVQADRARHAAQLPCQAACLRISRAPLPDRWFRPLRPSRRVYRVRRRSLFRVRVPAPPTVSSVEDH